MTNVLVREWRRVVRSFLATVTDEGFSAFLSRADREIYRDIDIPVAELHRRIKSMDSPTIHFAVGAVNYVDINPPKMIVSREAGRFRLNRPSQGPSNLSLAA
jgi:hypothetical protein